MESWEKEGTVVKGVYTRRTPREIVMILSAFFYPHFRGKIGKDRWYLLNRMGVVSDDIYFCLCLS